MTIGTECPHCESVFQVDAELVGKAMRCPNPTCREVFTVSGETAAAVVPPPTPAAPPPARGSVADYLPVFDAEPVDAEVVPAPPVTKAAPLPPIPTAAALPTKAARSPKVMDWSEDDAPPGTAAPPKARRPARRDDDSEIPIRSRTRGGGLSGKVILFALASLVLVAAGGTVAFFMLNKARSEEQEATAADGLFKEGKYFEAKRKYDGLMTDFPDSGDVPKYKFFSALAQTQADASSVTVKDDPTAAQNSLAALIAEHGESPMAQPNTGYGADVVQVGLKVCAAVGDHANEQVKKYQAKREDAQLLDKADKAIDDGRKLLPTLEKFRDKSGLSLEDARKKFDEVEAGVKKERDRLAALAPWRDLSADPTDVRIDQFEKAMKAVGLDKDGEVLRMAAAAKTALRKAVGFVQEAKAAGNPPLETGATLTVAPRVSGTPDVRQLVGKQDVVFGIAHGVLYALDSRNGAKLWHERVSAAARATDAPLRVTLADGTTDWVLVPSVRAGQPALTARDTLTGEAKWHQQLPAPVLGKPVRIGDRLVVALADPLGTLLYLNLTDGTQLGSVPLRQAIGGGITGLRGSNYGHGFVVVPADARRVFVFEVGKPGDDGKRLPPQVVRVFATGHPRDSLRGPPLVLDPDDASLPRRVILAQSDGPAEMKLRSFPIPPAADLGNGSADGDARVDQMAEASVVGWSWFPPVSDGERLAVCTDKGVFAAFGLNQPGQTDKPIYALPGQLADPDPAAVSRCQVVMMDEDSFWVILNGKLNRLKVASDPRGGQKILPSLDSRLVGEPVAAPQVRAADGLAVITTKATETGTIHLQAFDTNSGEERWRRQLGAVAVGPPVALADGGRLLVDECGGIYRATAEGAELTPLDKCEPKPGCVSRAVTTVSADGSRMWVAVHWPSPDGVKLSVRVVRDGKPEGEERAMSIPAGLAGNAVAVGDHLVFPLANKFLYRIGLKDAEPTQGPAWAGPNAKPDSVCHLSATPDGHLLFGDGGTQVFRRKWVAEKEVEKTGGPWELTGPATTPAVSLTAEGKEWILAADGGGVAVFDPTKPTADPVRRWHGAAQGDLPAGRASALVVASGKAYWSAGGAAVASAAPGSDKPAWVFLLPQDAGEVAGITPVPTGLLVTGTSGVVYELNDAGEVKALASLPAGGPRAVAAAVGTDKGDVLLPLSDGTVSRLAVQKR